MNWIRILAALCLLLSAEGTFVQAQDNGFGHDHPHAPGACKWCEAKQAAPLQTPLESPDFSPVKMPATTDSLSLLIGLLAGAVLLSAVFLRRVRNAARIRAAKLGK